MNPTAYAARLGLSRGWIELRNSLSAPTEWGYNMFFAVAFVLVLFFQRNSTVEGTTQSLASVVLPSIVGMMVAFGGLLGAAGSLSFEREDGTLLRAKAVPDGMVGYLIAKITAISLTTALSLAIILGAGLILVPELASAGVVGWLTLVGLVALGLLATLPWGAVVGSLVTNPGTAFLLTMLPIGGLAAISGVFYPIDAMPEWVQAIAQVFPVYWLGLGMRSALLPDSAVAVEIGESWRHLETVGVLGAWAVAGLLLAPPILRRMARRESGSAMEERHQLAMRRTA